MSRLRHDTEDLFNIRLLRHSPWQMTPCLVRVGGEWQAVRTPEALLCLSDDTEVLCGWPGKARQDFWEFTVGDFRKARALAASRAEQTAAPAAASGEGNCPQPVGAPCLSCGACEEGGGA